ncbi:translocon-associated protein subunit alpha [Clonorchis sinensis]|uniref:Translocon-associated protein subunit alpha n=1 Tax=Clonorchis sinensis TaxID=79923 RepID=G7YFX5_CLOSI|nr:translocon-associated protein subunit alpha [Clonorchis sinensis]
MDWTQYLRTTVNNCFSWPCKVQTNQLATEGQADLDFRLKCQNRLLESLPTAPPSEASKTEESQEDENTRLFQLVHATGSRKSPVSGTIKDHSEATILNKKKNSSTGRGPDNRHPVHIVGNNLIDGSLTMSSPLSSMTAIAEDADASLAHSYVNSLPQKPYNGQGRPIVSRELLDDQMTPKFIFSRIKTAPTVQNVLHGFCTRARKPTDPTRRNLTRARIHGLVHRIRAFAQATRIGFARRSPERHKRKKGHSHKKGVRGVSSERQVGAIFIVQRSQSRGDCFAESTSTWRAVALELEGFKSSAKTKHRLESASGISVLAQDASVSNEDDEREISPPSTGSTEIDPTKGSPHIQAVLTLTNPPYGLYTEQRDISFPANKRSSLVAALINTHEGTTLPRFTLDLLEGSLHYPGYYSYHIQNFTRVRLQNTLEPGQEGSLSYSFKPAAELAGRSFDLCVRVYYHDENGIYYVHPLFNQTVNLYEVEEGIDTELLFLGVLVVAVGIVVLVGIWHWCSSKAARRLTHHKVAKVDETNGDKAMENEYMAILDGKKITKTADKLQLNLMLTETTESPVYDILRMSVDYTKAVPRFIQTVFTIQNYLQVEKSSGNFSRTESRPSQYAVELCGFLSELSAWIILISKVYSADAIPDQRKRHYVRRVVEPQMVVSDYDEAEIIYFQCDSWIESRKLTTDKLKLEIWYYVRSDYNLIRLTDYRTKYPFSNRPVTNSLTPSDASNASEALEVKKLKTPHIIGPQRPCFAIIKRYSPYCSLVHATLRSFDATNGDNVVCVLQCDKVLTSNDFNTGVLKTFQCSD